MPIFYENPVAVGLIIGCILYICIWVSYYPITRMIKSWKWWLEQPVRNEQSKFGIGDYIRLYQNGPLCMVVDILPDAKEIVVAWRDSNNKIIEKTVDPNNVQKILSPLLTRKIS